MSTTEYHAVYCVIRHTHSTHRDIQCNTYVISIVFVVTYYCIYVSTRKGVHVHVYIPLRDNNHILLRYNYPETNKGTLSTIHVTVTPPVIQIV